MTVPLLDGFRVLELTETPAGAFCGRLLADLGCDVVKVEPLGGDEARRRGPFPGGVPDDEASAAFLFLNANKRGLTLELATATGIEIAARLAAGADVVVEDLTPGTFDVPADDRLVVVSISPFGRTGPRRDWKARPLTTAHAAGHAFPAGEGRPPAVAGGLFAELQCGLAAAVRCLAALAGRGERHVDVSKHDVLAALARPEPPSVGGMLPCRDGWIQCVVEDDRGWSSLLELLGHPAWADDPTLATQAGRLARAGEVRDLLAAETATCPVDELEARGRDLGCPVAKALLPHEVLGGGLLRPSLPFAVRGETPGGDRPAPRLGADNAALLEELGFDHATSALLVATGVV